jgi:hypothetical protein
LGGCVAPELSEPGISQDWGYQFFPWKTWLGGEATQKWEFLESRLLQGRFVNVIYPAYQAAELFRSLKEKGLFDRPEPGRVRKQPA